MLSKVVLRYLRQFAFVGVVTVLLAGCVTSRGTVHAFYEPSYVPGTVQSLAIPGIRNSRLAPAESQQIGRNVNQAIVASNPSLAIISANDFNNLLNDLGIVSDYADFIEDYATSGIANRRFLEVLNSNGIDAVVIGELSSVYQQDGAYGRNKGESRVTISFTIVSTSTNDVIWSASADGIKGTATVFEPAPPLIEAIQLAIDKIAEAIPRL